jgi:hypothetical protein
MIPWNDWGKLQKKTQWGCRCSSQGSKGASLEHNSRVLPQVESVFLCLVVKYADQSGRVV